MAYSSRTSKSERKTWRFGIRRLRKSKRALNKDITPGWARCGDLLDTASSKHQRAVMVQVPVTSFNGEKVDIEVETRKEIFGECSDEDPPVSPDVEDRQRRGN